MMPKVKNQRHPAEVLTNKYLETFPRARELADDYRKNRSLYGDVWPAWCDLPMAAVYAIMTNGAPEHDAQEMMANYQSLVDLSALTMALIWPNTKGIYRYDATLYQALADQLLDGAVPGDALRRLPEHCVYIDVPVTVGGEGAQGFWAWLENDVGSGRPTGLELRLLYFMQDGSLKPWPILLMGTIQDGVKAMANALEARVRASYITMPEGMQLANYPPTFAELALAVKLVLYLCAAAPDTHAPKGRCRVKNDYGEPRNATEWDVGIRIGSVIRKYNNAPDDKHDLEAVGKGHSSPRPHIRRAHWHYYWTGSENSGTRKVILHWLPPIPVGINWRDELPGVVHPVK